MINTAVKREAILIHTLLFALAMLTGGLLSVFFGKELGWDLANYHYYQPYAILHGRTQIDFWPTSFIHQYINPTIDFLPYFLINHVSPRMTVFILGAVHGINLWLLFIIAKLFLPEKEIGLACVITLFGMYGPAALSGIGSFQNDDLVSLFVLGSVFLFVRGIQLSAFEPSRLYFPCAGLLLGIGIGLKLTAGTFAVGAVLATLLLPLPLFQRIKLLFWVGVALIIGLLVSSGYWMLLMWQQHHNPFFPFFNQLFHSSDFASINWRDTRFLPEGIWETLFFPFYFSWDGRTADGGFRDFRFAIVYVLFLFVGITFLRKQIRRNDARHWLFAFFIFSYIVWQCFFSIYRYLTPLEMLAPLMIYLLLQELALPNYVQTSALVIIFYLLFYSMSPIPVSRARWYDKSFFNVQLPSNITHTQTATVLIAYSVYMQGKREPWLDANPRPQAYLIPYFPPGFHFIGVPFGHEKYLHDQTLQQVIHRLLTTSSHPIYLLTSAYDMPELYRAAASFGLMKAGPCEKIFSDRQKITQQKILLCPVKNHG